jgi:hypothetical protein
MRERTVKIGSAGKLFGMTGWKVGFLCAAPALTKALAAAHQFLTFTTPPNLQAGVAWGLEHHRAWFDEMPSRCSAPRSPDGRPARGGLCRAGQPGDLLPERRPDRVGDRGGRRDLL